MTSIVNLAHEPKKNGGGYPAGGAKGYGIDRDFVARLAEPGYFPFMAAMAHRPDGWLPVPHATSKPTPRRNAQSKKPQQIATDAVSLTT